jgi:serine/threonine kinase PknH
MALFISYSSLDRPAVDALTTALRRGRQEVWFDQQLGGGDSWWNMILEQIRSCDVFIVALSNSWLQSKPCQSELRYAQALNRPVLPVRIGQIDSVRVNPLAAFQMIDAQNPSVDAGIQLVTAVHSLQARPHPLPNPMPQEPPVPFAYITHLGNALAASEVSPQQQIQLLAELRSRLEEDGDDPSARGDIAQLLRMLRQRHDVTYRTGSEIDQLLASIEALNAHSSGAWASAKSQLARAVGAARSAPAQPRPAPQAVGVPAPPRRPPSGANTPAVPRRKGGIKKRLILIGGAALVIVVAVAALRLFLQGDDSSSGGKLASYLLGPQEVGAIVKDTNLVVEGPSGDLRTPQSSLSNPDCAPAHEAVLAASYQGAAGFSAVGSQVVHSRDADTRRIVEGVAAFSSADAAGAFIQASLPKWNACAGRTVNVTVNGKPATWLFSTAQGTPTEITTWQSRADGTGSCSHALQAVSDKVIDVSACGPTNGTSDATRIAQQIAPKLGP